MNSFYLSMMLGDYGGCNIVAICGSVGVIRWDCSYDLRLRLIIGDRLSDLGLPANIQSLLFFLFNLSRNGNDLGTSFSSNGGLLLLVGHIVNGKVGGRDPK